MARMYWPNTDPLGRRFHTSFTSAWDSRGSTDPAREHVTVVGIVADARTESLELGSVPQIYLDAYQTNSKELAVFMRGQLDTAAIPEQVRTLVQSVNPELPVDGTQTLDDAVSASLAERRLSMEIVACFAVTALLLAALGIYGTISCIVSERTREIGIRLALGAERGGILAMVLRQGLALAIAGAALGLIGGLIVGRLMGGLLYGVSPHDPLTLIGVTVVLSGVALLAAPSPPAVPRVSTPWWQCVNRK